MRSAAATRDLAATLDLLEWVGPRYTAELGPPDPRRAPLFTRLSALVEEPGLLERLLERVGARWSTPTATVRAAFLFGPLSGRLTRIASGCLMLGAPVPRMRAEDVVVRLGETGRVQELRLVGPPAGPAGGGPARIRDELLGAHLAPLIHRLHALGGPGPASLWGMVADGLADACLTLGRALGDEDAGRRAASELVRRCRPPLRRPARFLAVSAGGRRELAVALQSCCLAHALPGGGRCPNCPLLPEEERRARLGERLAARRQDPPALAARASGCWP